MTEIATESKIRVSIVVPCMNEETVIGEFIDWCKEGLARANIPGEILILDSSHDESPNIARAHGAQVITIKEKGLGKAYQQSIPFIRGKYVILGDCDLTYDFREIDSFIKKLEEGSEFVIGTRLKGQIQEGAMPPLHRYFGTPLTTTLLNFIYRTNFSDIHCGMRALTTDLFRRMNIISPSWEYASEMVLKSATLNARIAEIPIKFYRDRANRVSHHKRASWLSPWHAGWINMKIMFIFAPDFFLLKPGILLLAIGATVSLALSFGPLKIGPITFGLYTMLLGAVLAMIGFSAIQLGTIGKLYHKFDRKFTLTVRKYFSYTRGCLLAVGLFAVGTFYCTLIFHQWMTNEFIMTNISYSTVLGLLCLILGFQTFTFSLILEMLLLPLDSNKNASSH